MVRRDFTGHGQALRLGGADELEAPFRGDVAYVVVAARELRELEVAIDLELLAKRRPAEHAEASGRPALVDDAVGGERLDLAVREHGAVELRDVVHAGPHHAGALHAVPVV